jgi:uncharacterized membrane protein (DUF485 family)
MAEDEISEQNIDWEGIKASPEFQELVKQKRAFVIPATIFFLTYYMAFIVLCAYASDFMGRSVYEGLTVGYTLALTQFLMVLVLGLLYLKRSANVFDPLADKAVKLHAVPDDDGPRRETVRDDHRDGTGAVAPSTPRAAR